MESTGTVPAEIVTRLRAAGCVFAEDEAGLLLAAAQDSEQLEALVAERVAGEPLEYLLGWVEFRGLRVGIVPGVFVPRQRSAFLVQRALDTAPAIGDLGVLDLCCGCGALGQALTGELRAAGRTVHLAAADIDPVATACATQNLAGMDAAVHTGDLFAALPVDLRGRIDILLANVPYVPTGRIAGMPPEARDHEPSTALDGGSDGLAVLRRVVTAAPGWLAPTGRLHTEIGTDQIPAALELLESNGWHPEIARSPEYGATVLSATVAGG